MVSPLLSWVLAGGSVRVARPASTRSLAIAAAIGPGYKVQTGEDAGAEAAEGLAEFAGFMGYIFLGFGLVAVFVSIFLIINTFTIIVAQRQRELALLRAIGAGRDQVVRSVLLEALIIGIVASLLGFGFGVLLGWGLSSMVGGFLFSGLSVELIVPATTAWALVIGIGVTLLSALMPALRASRVPPVAAMRDAVNPPKPLRTITIAGAGVTAAGIALLALGLTDNLGGNNLVGVLVGVLVSFVGVTLLTPILSRPLVAFLGLLASWTFPGKLGRLNAARNPRRTAITAAALMIAVALVTAIASLASSMRATGEEVFDTSLSSDLIVAGTQSGANVPSFSRDTVAELSAIPGVAAVGDVYADFFGTRVDGEQTELVASEHLGDTLRIFGATVIEGSTANLPADGIIVDESRAEDFGVGVGDTVTVRFGAGETADLTVAAILEDNIVTNGWWVSSEQIEHFAIPKPLQAFIDVAEGEDVIAVQDRVRQAIADEPEVTVTNNAEFIDQQLGILDVLLGAVQVLLALAMIIAVIGVVNTLVLSVLERTRELGLLRAVGMTRGQSRWMITVESVIICLFGALLGIGVGIGLGWAVQQGLESEGLTTFALPWGLIAAYLGAALVVGLLAAIAPAARAAKLNVLNAIAYE
jgi:putative ABC transport system permease protein